MADSTFGGGRYAKPHSKRKQKIKEVRSAGIVVGTPGRSNEVGSKIGPYQLIGVLGKGGFGVVYRGLDSRNGRTVAVKRINLHGVKAEDREGIEAEVQLLKKVDHKNIVRYIDTIQAQSSLNIVIEFVEGGALNNQLKKFPTSPPESLVAFYIKQVLEGLAYLHKRGVIHRDIKGANLLVSKDGVVKLADFGVATKMQKANKTHSVVGTPYWMAPEIIQMNAERSAACDIWSLGCTVIELLTGKPPFFDCNPMTALYQIVRAPHPPFPDTVSTDLKDFLLKCFQKDPTKRIEAAALLEHNWLKEDKVAASGDDVDVPETPVKKPTGLTISISPPSSPSPSEPASPTSPTSPGASLDNFFGESLSPRPSAMSLSENKDEKKADLDWEDMVNMPIMKPELVLDNVRNRFFRDVIYTNVSSILISINPYKVIKDLYAHQQFKNYHAVVADSTIEALPPHLFKIARAAYIEATNLDGSPSGGRSQSILISGESGAGKTEATKFLLQYISMMSKHSQKKSASALDGDADDDRSIQAKMLHANPVLEAFGNAKTLRNDNSSRFGKWTSINFTNRVLTGGTIIKYLLEESRVTMQQIGNRNYNIFYQVCSGTDGYDVTQFRYLNHKDEETRTIQGVDDKQMYKRTLDAMWYLGFEEVEMSSVIDVVKAVLQLGNIDFAKDSTDHAVVLGSDDKTRDSKEGAKSNEALNACAKLLGVSADELKSLLCVKMLFTGRQSMVNVPRTVETAQDTRDSIAKTTYARLMTWLVWKINQSLAGRVVHHGKPKEKEVKEAKETKELKAERDAREAKSRTASPPRSSKPLPIVTAPISSFIDTSSEKTVIGILDIFGFEVFDVNGFEQLCINYANERLQQHFIANIFTLEQELYKKEGLDISSMTFQDNQACVDVLEKKPIGVFPLLEDELSVPGGSDVGYIAKLHKAQDGQSQFFEKPRMAGKPEFTIKHYALPVTYTATGFLDKNRNKTGEDVLLAFRSSSSALVKTMFTMDPELGPKDEIKEEKLLIPLTSAPPVAGRASFRAQLPGGRGMAKGGGASSSSSVGSAFRTSLQSLLASIRSTKSHFVRCVKPNATKKSGLFTDDLVLRQLVTSGVMDAVTIRQLGYADRFTREEFVKRYWCLIPLSDKKNVRVTALSAADTEKFIQQLLEPIAAKCKLEEKDKSSAASKMALWQCGKYRVFMKHQVYINIEHQRFVRRVKAAVLMQSLVRGWIGRRLLQRLKGVWKKVQVAIQEQNVSRLERSLREAEEVHISPIMVREGHGELRRLELEIKYKTALLLAMTNKSASLSEWLANLGNQLASAEAMQSGCTCSAPFQALVRGLTTIYASLLLFSKQLQEAVIEARQQAGLTASVKEKIKRLGDDISSMLLSNASSWQLLEDQVRDIVSIAVGDLTNYAEVRNCIHRLTKLDEAADHVTGVLAEAAKPHTKSEQLVHTVSELNKALEMAHKTELIRPQVEQARRCVFAFELAVEIISALEAHPPTTAALSTVQQRLLPMSGEEIDEYIRATGLESIDAAKTRVNTLLSHLKTAHRLTLALKQGTQHADLEELKTSVKEAEDFLTLTATLKLDDSALKFALTTAQEVLTKLNAIHDARQLVKQALDASSFGMHSSGATAPTSTPEGAAGLVIASARSTDASLDAEHKEVKDVEELLKEALNVAVQVGLPKTEIETVSRRLEGVRVTRELSDAIASNQLDRMEKVVKKVENGLKKNIMDVTTTRLSDALETAKHRITILNVVKQLDELANKVISNDLSTCEKQHDDLEAAIKKALVAGAKESDLTFANKRLKKIITARDKLREAELQKQKAAEEEKKRKEEEKQRKEAEKQRKEEERKQKQKEEEEKKQKEEEERQRKKKEKEEEEKKRKEKEEEEKKKKKEEKERKKAEEKEKKAKSKKAKQEFRIIITPPTLRSPLTTDGAPPTPGSATVEAQTEIADIKIDEDHFQYPRSASPSTSPTTSPVTSTRRTSLTLAHALTHQEKGYDSEDTESDGSETESDDEFLPPIHRSSQGGKSVGGAEETRSRTESFKVRRLAKRNLSDSGGKRNQTVSQLEEAIPEYSVQKNSSTIIDPSEVTKEGGVTTYNLRNLEGSVIAPTDDDQESSKSDSDDESGNGRKKKEHSKLETSKLGSGGYKTPSPTGIGPADTDDARQQKCIVM